MAHPQIRAQIAALKPYVDDLRAAEQRFDEWEAEKAKKDAEIASEIARECDRFQPAAADQSGMLPNEVNALKIKTA